MSKSWRIPDLAKWARATRTVTSGDLTIDFDVRRVTVARRTVMPTPTDSPDFLAPPAPRYSFTASRGYSILLQVTGREREQDRKKVI